MGYFLIIVFFINGETVIPDDWSPQLYPTADECVAEAKTARNNLSQTMSIEDFRASCLKAEFAPDSFIEKHDSAAARASDPNAA
jgi:hypothetical protein